MLTAMLTEAKAKSSFPEATKRTAAYSYCKYHAEDADEHADNLKDWDQSYDQLSASRFDGSLVDAWFNDIQMFHETTNQSVIQTRPRSGFWHLSHFSSDYRTMFGELPSETLRKAQ